MTYGWNTTKQENGWYRWTVYKFVYGEGTTTLHAGRCPTRAQAIGAAKRHVRPYRRAA